MDCSTSATPNSSSTTSTVCMLCLAATSNGGTSSLSCWLFRAGRRGAWTLGVGALGAEAGQQAFGGLEAVDEAQALRTDLEFAQLGIEAAAPDLHDRDQPSQLPLILRIAQQDHVLGDGGNAGGRHQQL